ncbi:hypothetical protein ACN28G_00505 [Micromonospora sp. WMMA1923]|uniref:hypothetical protein n=1 Tax=Micromonospora sp. WMMA1923 TaxID=3404125 RepID=UPI003B95B0C8
MGGLELPRRSGGFCSIVVLPGLTAAVRFLQVDVGLQVGVRFDVGVQVELGVRFALVGGGGRCDRLDRADDALASFVNQVGFRFVGDDEAQFLA